MVRLPSLVVVVLLLCGCIPIRDLIRPKITGRVVDASGAPVALAEVEACTTAQFRVGVRRHTITRADASGRFHFKAYKEWSALPGEAPFPTTYLKATDSKGETAIAVAKGEPETLVIGVSKTTGDPRCHLE